MLRVLRTGMMTIIMCFLNKLNRIHKPCTARVKRRSDVIGLVQAQIWQ